MNSFTSHNNSTFISSNSDLQEIWVMRNNVKKQLKDVEEKLEAARKTVYLPSYNDDDEDNMSPFSKDESLSRPIRRANSSLKSPSDHFHLYNGSVSNGLGETTPKRNRVELEQRVLSKRKLPGFEPNEDILNEYRTVKRNEAEYRVDQPTEYSERNQPMSINEQAKFYTVQDFLRRDLKSTSSPSKTAKEAVFDDLSEKLREIKSQTGAIRREIIAQNLLESSKGAQQTKPKTTPRIETINVENNGINIDKNHAAAESTRSPRIFSYANVQKVNIRKIEHPSDRRQIGRSSSVNLARVESIRRKYSSQESETGKIETKRSTSSHESISLAGNGFPAQKRTSVISTSSSTTTDQTSNRSTKLSLSEDVQSVEKHDSDAATSLKKSLPSSSSAQTSSVSSVNNDRRRRSSNERANSLIPHGLEVSTKGLEKFELKKAAVKLKKKTTSSVPVVDDKSSQQKSRSYDADEVRRFMAKQKRERKSNADASTTVGSIEKVRHYDQDLVKEYVKQQKFHRKSDAQRAKEKMERAKILQSEKMKQVLDEQRSLRNVPLIQLILNANSFDKRPLVDPNLSKADLVDLVREKYKDSIQDDLANHQSFEIQILNGSRIVNEASVDEHDNDIILAPASMRELNGFSRNLPTTSTADINNGDEKRLNNEEHVQIYETPKERRRTNDNANAVDEYNIINTILRKHPELRISSSTRNEIKNQSVNDQQVRLNRVPRLDLSRNDEPNEILSKRASSSVVVLPKRDSDRRSFVDDRRLSSEHTESEPSSVQPSASVSSLTLSTPRSSPTYENERDRNRQLLIVETDTIPNRLAVSTSSESLSSVGRSESETRLSPSALQMQVTAGLNYLHFVQDSIQQVAAVDRMNVVSTTHQNASAFGHLIHAERSNQQLHKDLQQVRLNTERQRITLDAEKIIAEERRQLAAEMSESQRRLMDTIFETNQRMTDYRERNSEMLTKLATEVATTAATSAVLAAFKQQQLSPQEHFNRSVEVVNLSSSSTQTSVSSEIDEPKKHSNSEDNSRDDDQQNSFLCSTLIADEANSNASSSQSLLRTVTDDAKTVSPSIENTIKTISDEAKSNASSKHTSVQTVVDEAKTASSSTQTSTVANKEKSNTLSVQTAEEANSISSSTQTSISTVADAAKSNSSSTQTSVPMTADQTNVNSSSTQTSVPTAVDTARSSSSNSGEEKPNSSSANETSTVNKKDKSSRSGSVDKEIEIKPSDKKKHIRLESSETTTHTSASDVVTTESKTTDSSSRSNASEKESPLPSSKKVSKPSGKTSKILHEFLRQNGSKLDDVPVSPSSLSVSDMTEMESRIQALKTDLKERKDIAEKLKFEYKRRTREGFKVTERSLTKQIQSYNEFIDQARLQLKDLERVNDAGGTAISSGRSSTPPKIMSPRNSDSEGPTPLSPRRRLRSAISSPRSSSSTSRANSEEKTLRESSTVQEEKTVNSSTVVTEKLSGERIFLTEKIVIDEDKTDRNLSLKSDDTLKSDKIIVPPLNIVDAIVDVSKPLVVSSRKLSVDVETTEEVSDVPEDIEDEIVDSEKTKTSSDSKVKENNNNYSEEIFSSTHDTSTPRSEKNLSEKESPKTKPTLGSEIISVEPSDDDEPKCVTSESSSQQKERLLASVLNSFVSLGVAECLDLWKLKKDKLHHDAASASSVDENISRGKEDFEDKISFDSDPAERLSTNIFNEFLTDAIGSCVRIAIAKREMHDSVGIISRKELGRVLELTKPNKTPERTPTSSNDASPRSPRSPSVDKYISEIYREPNQNRAHEGEKSPRSLEKVDVPPLDTDEMFNDEAWMDDDFGLGESSDDVSSPKKKSSPKSPKLDLSKFTTDIFSAVPCTVPQIRSIVDCCVEKIYDQRRFGEPMMNAEKPKDLFIVGRSSDDSLDLSLNRNSDAAYRDFLFNYCKEIVSAIYAKDPSSTALTSVGENAIWKKSERLKLSQYCKIPPKNVDELKIIVMDIVKERLNLEPSTKTGREKLVARKKLDKIDEVLLPEMYREEPDWTNYDEEELKVKFELSDSIMKTILDECFTSKLLNFTKQTGISK